MTCNSGAVCAAHLIEGLRVATLEPEHASCVALVLTHFVALQGEGRARFVERVQQALAAELGVPISDVTLQAKRAVIVGERAKAGQRRALRR